MAADWILGCHMGYRNAAVLQADISMLPHGDSRDKRTQRNVILRKSNADITPTLQSHGSLLEVSCFPENFVFAGRRHQPRRIPSTSNATTCHTSTPDSLLRLIPAVSSYASGQTITSHLFSVGPHAR